MQFGDFTLDPDNRILHRGGTVIEVGGRYFDALLLLTRKNGQLITKQQLLDEVWRGVPVTDEALTQCIRTLRRALGDDASAPRFIETVQKHGYRFVAQIEKGGDQQVRLHLAEHSARESSGIVRWLILTGGGGIGGAAAGATIGLIYGVMLAEGAQASGTGLSLIAVIACCGALAGLFSALAVAGGLAMADAFTELGNGRAILGGAGGGLVAGVVFNMIGRDAISLLFGRRLADLPGGLEGAIMGAVIGAALWWARQSGASRARVLAGTLLSGGVAGFFLPWAGGTLFAGSLFALSATVPNSLFAEPLYLPVAGIWGLAIVGAFEGALFCAGVAAGLLHAFSQAVVPGEGT